MADEAGVKKGTERKLSDQEMEKAQIAGKVECGTTDATDQQIIPAEQAEVQQRRAAHADADEQGPCGTYTKALGVEDIGRLVASHLPLVSLEEAERASKQTGASLNSGGQRPRGKYVKVLGRHDIGRQVASHLALEALAAGARISTRAGGSLSSEIQARRGSAAAPAAGWPGAAPAAAPSASG